MSCCRFMTLRLVFLLPPLIPSESALVKRESCYLFVGAKPKAVAPVTATKVLSFCIYSSCLLFAFTFVSTCGDSVCGLGAMNRILGVTTTTPTPTITAAATT